jgi:hypothetical protein
MFLLVGNPRYPWHLCMEWKQTLRRLRSGNMRNVFIPCYEVTANIPVKTRFEAFVLLAYCPASLIRWLSDIARSWKKGNIKLQRKPQKSAKLNGFDSKNRKTDPIFPHIQKKRQNLRNTSATNSRTTTERQRSYQHPINSIWEANSSLGSQEIIL